jgi:phosphopantetheine--protein transferase-like protein
MPKPRNLGNDIVAITSPRCREKVQDSRFLHRVFSEEEREAILASRAPDASLWLHWAGKEAIFKSSTKALGAPPVFHHPIFRVSFSGEAEATTGAPLTLQGNGTYQDLFFHLKCEIHPDFVHAVAWEVDLQGSLPEGNVLQWSVVHGSEGVGDSEEELRLGFSPAEWACVSHKASALTRLGARTALALALGVEEARLEIRCGPGSPGRRVPLVFLDEEEAPLDLTLSHDAHLMAWAFLLPEKDI